jgi:hypothetical protein
MLVLNHAVSFLDVIVGYAPGGVIDLPILAHSAVTGAAYAGSLARSVL